MCFKTLSADSFSELIICFSEQLHPLFLCYADQTDKNIRFHLANIFPKAHSKHCQTSKIELFGKNS